MDLIAAFRTFLRVAEVGSFSAVAEERGVTQPAVSRQVSALEEHFGTSLVQRSTLDGLLKKHEELSIDLILHDRLRDLIEEGIDLQLCVGQVSDSALISRRIGASTAFLVAAPAYLKGRAMPEQPADLQK